MNIKFAPTFLTSLRELRWHNTKIYKAYETFRYDIPRFFKNVWVFRKEMCTFQPWDYTYNLELLKKSLEQTSTCLENGYEEDISRNKKIKAIKRAIQILSNIKEYDYIELAEKKLGMEVVGGFEFLPIEEVDEEGEHMYEMKKLNIKDDANNSKIFDLSRKLEEDEWKELWTIFQGQDYTKFKHSKTKNYNKHHDEWAKQFDGSGMKGWWD